MAELVLMKGNEAIAEAAIRAGCRHYFGYPITPQTEIAAYMAKKMPKIGGVFLQAESEVASINMVYGAAATGCRVMTSSSSPGISLKSEGLSYIAGSDVPALVVNVQRGGPGLGGIQPSQSDYFQATKGGGHGDYRMIVLAPASVQEMASLTMKGFDLADKYRMTSMILADGTIGQMMEPISFEDCEVKQYEKPWALTGTNCERKHNIVNSLYLKPEELEAKNFERYEKYAVVEEKRPGEYLPVYENERGTYIFNSKDLCMIEYIPEMIEAGIDSFKIEGRMKTALYVATVARTYRKAIDDYLESEEKYRANLDWYRAEIAKCTYRQFTTGFYFGKPDENTQIYDNNTYVNEYIYLGIVEEIADMTSAFLTDIGLDAKTQLVRIEQRNKFCVGDTIEIMKPSGDNVPVTVEAMYNEDGEAVESCPHSKQRIWLQLSSLPEQYDLLRVKNEAE